MNGAMNSKHNTAVTTSYSAYHSYVTSAISTDTQRYVILPADETSILRKLASILFLILLIGF